MQTHYIMDSSRIQGLLALLVVGSFLLIVGILSLYPVLTKAGVDPSTYMPFYEKIVSSQSGIVGVIIGYYFSRAVEAKKTTPPTDKNPDASPGPEKQG